MNDTEQPNPSTEAQSKRRWLGGLLPTVLAIAFVAGIVIVGQRTGWTLPSFSALTGKDDSDTAEWCTEHTVPEMECVECNPSLMPREKEFGWCRVHGVPECPLEHPEVAQLPTAPVVAQADRERAARSLAFAPRVENSSKCKLHQRRIQFATAEAANRLGVDVQPVKRAAITESVVAGGEIAYDPRRTARISSRVPGSVRRVEKKIGDTIRQGDILAIVDSADVGKAKAELQQAMTQLEVKTQHLARLRELEGTAVSGQSVQEAEAGLAEAKVRMLTAEQALLNLGLPVHLNEWQRLRPEDLSRRLQFLGLPDAVVQSLGAETASNNLIGVASPINGEIISRSVMSGDHVDAGRVLFVVADTRQMWLTLNVRLEDAELLKPGLAVQFRHEGHTGWDQGTVRWISPAADEKTRTVPVRVELPNTDGRHQAHTFGSARIVLREEPDAIVIPNQAMHWDGDCNVVFVRDKHYTQADAPKVFHVRKVRPGAKDGDQIEIIAGVLPGELVATGGSGLLKAELLKNKLGAC